MSSLTPDPLDELIAQALRRQPELSGPPDLAQRALRLASAADEREVALIRMGKRLRLCSVAAGILIVVAMVGWWWSYSALAVAMAELNSTFSTESASPGDLTSIGIGVLAITVILLLLQSTARGGSGSPATAMEFK